ncbi:hydrolase [Thauera sp. 2A1]|uniref:hydrolase n=1 Tax=Thauera sp. 2A1 TaxID=2570191 RepID=UPI0012918453|nr:hydrolase [Thauera sp. 2A1]KAI5914660.1 hydrolase [Thauera sp. 2A1]
MHRERILRVAGGIGLGLGIVLGAQAADTASAIPERPVTAAPPRAEGGTRAETVILPPYQSPLETYRPYRPDEPMRPWREVNDEAGSLGGHAGQLDRRARPGAQP